MKVRPVNLAELAKVRREHSIFAPSSGNMWVLCAGSLVPNILNPRPSGYEAAEGTVAHWVAYEWIRTQQWYPKQWVGTSRTVDGHEIEITEEMLEHVHEYVVRCSQEEGDHYNEQRVDISRVTPIPDQGGTADYAVARFRKLKIIDFKYGMRRVFAAWNMQLLLYALGRFWDLDVIYDFEEIELVIVQPRIGNYDSWTIKRDQLMEFAGYVRERARMAWKLDAPRTPGSAQCEYCSESGACTAQTIWLDGLVDFGSADYDLEVTSEQMERKSNESRVFRPTPMVMPDFMSLDADEMAALLPYRDMVEGFFKSMQRRAQEIEEEEEGSIDGFKNVERRTHRRWALPQQEIFKKLDQFDISPLDLLKTVMITPNQSELLVKKMKRSKEEKTAIMQALAGLIERPKGVPELVPASDPRPPYSKDIDVDDIFGI